MPISISIHLSKKERGLDGSDCADCANGVDEEEVIRARRAERVRRGGGERKIER